MVDPGSVLTSSSCRIGSPARAAAWDGRRQSACGAGQWIEVTDVNITPDDRISLNSFETGGNGVSARNVHSDVAQFVHEKVSFNSPGFLIASFFIHHSELEQPHEERISISTGAYPVRIAKRAS
jgi:hypothetical protein